MKVADDPQLELQFSLNRSNQRARPLASIPTRPFIPCAAS
jgi:hypothetical protein